ncbi:MAG: hypothetical protein SV686_08025 [Thermodesulfobacteriota bacterium]|nr:hypothetical protein [Thermodesulfobacteriota bacterium]
MKKEKPSEIDQNARQRDKRIYSEEKNLNKGRDQMSGVWVIILIVLAWIVLQAYILPKFGIST